MSQTGLLPACDSCHTFRCMAGIMGMADGSMNFLLAIFLFQMYLMTY